MGVPNEKFSLRKLKVRTVFDLLFQVFDDIGEQFIWCVTNDTYCIILGVSIITAISLDLKVNYTGRVDNLFCDKFFNIAVALSDIEKINRITVLVDTDRFADVLIDVNHLI